MFSEKIKSIKEKTCSHKATNTSFDGIYTMSYHQHDDVIVINSFEKKTIEPFKNQIKKLQKKYNVSDDNVFIMTQRGHDQ